MAIQITDRAAVKIKELIAREDKASHENIALSIEVQGGGCSGMQYKMGFIVNTEAPNNETIFESQGIRIKTSEESVLYLENVIIDYKDDVFEQGFVINNADYANTCGCGKSFS